MASNQEFRNQNGRNTENDRIEISKYCKFCKKHTAHKETK